MSSELHRRLALAALLLCVVPAPARPAFANNCRNGGSSVPDGIGGTGMREKLMVPVPEDEGGIGGTAAHPQGGIGGTASANPEGGIGGTAVRPEGGIGGTAKADGPGDEGGIGGTGIEAHGDTGVIGTVTGFASVCVGGIEIHYTATTPVEIDGSAARATDLSIGDVVEVVARGTGEELAAQQIAVRHIVSGPITATLSQPNTIEVVGQRVQLPDAAAARAAAAIAVGTTVQVSGLRRADGTIVASRIAATTGTDEVTLSGTVDNDSPENVRVAGVAVHTEQSLTPGDEVRVRGNWAGNGIVARSFEKISRMPFGGRVTEVEIEGYTHAASGTQMRIGAFEVRLPRSAKLPPTDTRVRLHGMVRGREMIADHIAIVPDFRPFRGDAGPPGNPPAGGPKSDVDSPSHGGPWPGAGEDRPGGNRPFGAPRDGRGGHFDGPDERPDLPDRAGPPPRPDQPDKPDRPERPPVPDRPPRPERGDHRPPHPERPPRIDIPGMRGRP